MKLHHLTHFVAVAAHGSLHRASASIGVAQSALSRSLSELEASLGTVLLDRSRRGSVLTAAGERFVLRAQGILEELRRSQEEARQHEGEREGEVTIAMSPTAQMLVLPAVLRRFRRNWPLVKLTLLDGLAETFETGLLTGTVDFYVGICPLRPFPREIVQSNLGSIDRIVVSRTDSAWRDETALRNLTHAPWIRIRSDADMDELDEVLRAAGADLPRSTHAAASMLTVQLLLETIDAVALVPSSWVSMPPAAGSFHRVPIRDDLGSLQMCTLRRTTLPFTPAAQALFDLVDSTLTKA